MPDENEPTYAERQVATWLGGVTKPPTIARIERTPGAVVAVWHEPLRDDDHAPRVVRVPVPPTTAPWWDPNDTYRSALDDARLVERQHWVHREWVTEAFEYDVVQNVLTFIGRWEDHHFWVWQEDGVNHVTSAAE